MCSLGALLALGSLVVVLPDVADEETLAFSDARSVSTRSLHWAMTAVAEARAAAARTAAQRLTCQPVAGTRLPLLLPTESLEDVQHHCEQDGRIQRQAARGSQHGFVTGVAWERASVIQTEAVLGGQAMLVLHGQHADRDTTMLGFVLRFVWDTPRH